MIKELSGSAVKLREGELLRREEANRQYLMKLENRYLLRNYMLEAGRYSGRGMDPNAMGGWEDPSCQLRGHFLGHWLSAAALRYQETADRELKAKTEVCEQLLESRLCLRIPDWVVRKAAVYVNDELAAQTDCTEEFVAIERTWKDGDRVILLLPIDLRFIPLPDDGTMGAFCYGPDVLAGITEQERVLLAEGDPTLELSADTEREWGAFRTFYRTENQDPGINFKKLNEIGYEPYQIYFKVKKERD